jgi:hypothetical protein
MSQPAIPASRHTRSASLPPLTGPLAWVVAALVALVVTILAGTVAPQLARHGAAAYRVSGFFMTVSDLLVLAGVVALAGTAAVRDGWLKRIAFVLAIAGSAGIVVAEVLLRVNADTGNAVFQGVGPIQALGFIGVGVGIVLTHAWTSWRRFVVLALGVYVPAVLVPALAASKGAENLPALGGYHALILAVGIAFAMEVG